MDVLLVCKQWRQVGLKDPRLWNFWGHFVSPRCLPVFASRSQAAPLFLRVDTDYIEHAFVTAWSTVFSEFADRDRVRELHLSGFETAVYQLLDAVSHFGDIHLPSKINSLVIDIETDFAAEHPMPSILLREFSHLSHLQLRKCLIDWNAPVLNHSNLTYLSISTTSEVSMSRLITILRNQLSLTHLILETKPIALEQVPAANLSHLQDIQLVGDAQSCMDIIANISFTERLTGVTLAVHSEVALQERIIPFLSRYYLSDKSPSVQCLAIESKLYDTLELQFGHTVAPGLPCFVLPPCNVDISHLVRYKAYGGDVENLLKTLPLANLRKLSIRDLDVPVAYWRYVIFESAYNLEELIVHGHDFRQAVIALNPSVIVQDAREAVPLADLKRLRITGLDFLDAYRGSGNSTTDLLLACAKARYEANVGLEILKIDYCYRIADDVLHELRGFVGQVLWDGRGVLEEDDGEDSDDKVEDEEELDEIELIESSQSE